MKFTIAAGLLFVGAALDPETDISKTPSRNLRNLAPQGVIPVEGAVLTVANPTAIVEAKANVGGMQSPPGSECTVPDIGPDIGKYSMMSIVDGIDLGVGALVNSGTTVTIECNVGTGSATFTCIDDGSFNLPFAAPDCGEVTNSTENKKMTDLLNGIGEFKSKRGDALTRLAKADLDATVLVAKFLDLENLWALIKTNDLIDSFTVENQMFDDAMENQMFDDAMAELKTKMEELDNIPIDATGTPAAENGKMRQVLTTIGLVDDQNGKALKQMAENLTPGNLPAAKSILTAIWSELLKPSGIATIAEIASMPTEQIPSVMEESPQREDVMAQLDKEMTQLAVITNSLEWNENFSSGAESESTAAKPTTIAEAIVEAKANDGGMQSPPGSVCTIPSLPRNSAYSMIDGDGSVLTVGATVNSSAIVNIQCQEGTGEATCTCAGDDSFSCKQGEKDFDFLRFPFCDGAPEESWDEFWGNMNRATANMAKVLKAVGKQYETMGAELDKFPTLEAEGLTMLNGVMVDMQMSLQMGKKLAQMAEDIRKNPAAIERKEEKLTNMAVAMSSFLPMIQGDSMGVPPIVPMNQQEQPVLIARLRAALSEATGVVEELADQPGLPTTFNV